MSYEAQFFATNASDWAQAVEITDNTTNLPLADAATASFLLQVTDNCDYVLLSASTDAGTITKPASNVVQWIFTRDQLRALCAGTTYRVGCRMTNDTGSILLFSGVLEFTDGGMGV
jgi:hypothetical protein